MISQELSAREKEVLKLVMEDLSSVEIADKLRVSVRTIDSHRANIIRKTKSRSLISLTKYAIRNGMVNGYQFNHIGIDTE